MLSCQPAILHQNVTGSTAYVLSERQRYLALVPRSPIACRFGDQGVACTPAAPLASGPAHWDQAVADSGSFSRPRTSSTVASSSAVFPLMFCV